MQDELLESVPALGHDQQTESRPSRGEDFLDGTSPGDELLGGPEQVRGRQGRPGIFPTWCGRSRLPGALSRRRTPRAVRRPGSVRRTELAVGRTGSVLGTERSIAGRRAATVRRARSGSVIRLEAAGRSPTRSALSHVRASPRTTAGRPITGWPRRVKILSGSIRDLAVEPALGRSLMGRSTAQARATAAPRFGPR